MKEHDGKEDEEGERVLAARVEAAPGYRRYAPITPDLLIRVTLRNLSAKPLSFVPVYVGKDGEEELAKMVLSSGEVRVRGWNSIPFNSPDTGVGLAQGSLSAPLAGCLGIFVVFLVVCACGGGSN